MAADGMEAFQAAYLVLCCCFDMGLYRFYSSYGYKLVESDGLSMVSWNG